VRARRWLIILFRIFDPGHQETARRMNTVGAAHKTSFTTSSLRAFKEQVFVAFKGFLMDGIMELVTKDREGVLIDR
jgi:hypothetical protein